MMSSVVVVVVYLRNSHVAMRERERVRPKMMKGEKSRHELYKGYHQEELQMRISQRVSTCSVAV